MYKRLMNYNEKNHILHNNQYGFRRNRSTTMAIIHLTEKIKRAIENNEFTIGIFLALSKAFDTVNHNILLQKLESYGIRGISRKWFQSYLTDRVQIVKYYKVLSEKAKINCGVPQGSVLGPLLFLLYINDIFNSSNLTSFIVFADDTNLFYSGKNIKQLELVVNNEIKKIFEWFKVNQLTLNIKKTNYIIFKSKKKQIKHDVKITVENDQLVHVEKTKFLGMIIDQHLTWNDHINYIANKVAKSAGILSKTRYFLKIYTLTTFTTLIQYTPINLYYGNIVWANNYSSKLKKLVKLQKRAVRIITSSSYYAESAPLFKKSKMLNLNQLNNLCIGLFMYDYIKGYLPAFFDNYFILNNKVHKHNTRTSNLIHKKRIRTNYGKFSVKNKGTEIWNKIPKKNKRFKYQNEIQKGNENTSIIISRQAIKHNIYLYVYI